MKTELTPNWSAREQAAGKRLRETWEEFFSGVRRSREIPEESLVDQAEELKISGVRARHESELLRYPNVVAVAEGIRTKRGRPTGERCVVVYVERKVPRARLSKREILPREIEGIPVDVVEGGRVEPLLG